MIKGSGKNFMESNSSLANRYNFCIDHATEQKDAAAVMPYAIKRTHSKEGTTENGLPLCQNLEEAVVLL
jgi:hypothetical protein